MLCAKFVLAPVLVLNLAIGHLVTRLEYLP